MDDEPRILEAISRTLSDGPYQVVTATSAGEALALFETYEIEVIVSDERMPGMSGLNLLATIQERYPDTVRIMLTGHASLDLAARAINAAGILRFLQKPVDARVLLEAIEAATTQYAYQRALAKREGQLPPIPAMDALSPREIEVMNLLVEGRRVGTIARELFISVHTVRNHVKAIFRKLGVHSQEELLERLREAKA